MKKENETSMKDPKDRLLASRAKEIKALREDVKGWQESVRLASAFTALLSLALAGDQEACRSIRSETGDGTYTVFVDKAALREALGTYAVESSGEEKEYRLCFYREQE